MSIWGSWREVKAIAYGHSGVYPWEKPWEKPRPKAEVTLSTVSDYVYDHEAFGEEVMPYLRLAAYSEGHYGAVVLTEKGARKLRDDLDRWLSLPKRQVER